MQNQRKQRKPKGPPRTPLQAAGASFVDQLGKAAVEKLKSKLGLNTETKYVDTAANLAVTAFLAPFITSLTTAIPQSLTDNGREGSTCRVTRTRIAFKIVNPVGNLLASSSVRVIVMRYRHLPTASVVAATLTADCLEFGGTGGIAALLSPDTFDPTFPGQKVYDKTFVLGLGTGTGALSTAQDVIQLAPQDFHLSWITTDTTGVYANSIGDMHVMYTICDQSTAGNFPVIDAVQRISYVDN
jgi:hypothetical protein